VIKRSKERFGVGRELEYKRKEEERANKKKAEKEFGFEFKVCHTQQNMP